MEADSPQRALVTGVAGFIGSHLAERLVSEGIEVVGIDCFTDYYARSRKRANIEALLGEELFSLVEDDLLTCELGALPQDTDAVFHLAAQPGVRASWDHFEMYSKNNIIVTQRLLEFSKTRADLRRFVYASSSSVYGNALQYPTQVGDTPAPNSPYGVTKLAAEHLCRAYASNWDVPVVSLRYFTVYGPRQRPDMAIHRMIDAALSGTPFPLFGHGEQVRDFSYVGDVVDATVRAAHASIAPGSSFNVAGGSQSTIRELLELVEELVGRPLRIDRQPAQAGDVMRTGGSTATTHQHLGWYPSTTLESGLRTQIEWHRQAAAREDPTSV